MGGVTGWHFAIMRHERYAPKLSNYSASPVGRTYPSAAGFITSELFFTDDNGTYIFPTRDFHPQIEIHDGKVDLEEFLSVHKKRIRKLSDKRLYIPRSEPYMEGHNTCIANHLGLLRSPFQTWSIFNYSQRTYEKMAFDRPILKEVCFMYSGDSLLILLFL